jgi:hypothetical protein
VDFTALAWIIHSPNISTEERLTFYDEFYAILSEFQDIGGSLTRNQRDEAEWMTFVSLGHGSRIGMRVWVLAVSVENFIVRRRRRLQP